MLVALSLSPVSWAKGVGVSRTLLQTSFNSTDTCKTELWEALSRLVSNSTSDASAWDTVFQEILQGGNCTSALCGYNPSSKVITWLRFPAWYNGISWNWIQRLYADPKYAPMLRNVYFDEPDGLPALGAISGSSSMRDTARNQQDTYGFTSTDMAAVPSMATWNAVSAQALPPNTCINGTDPRGLIHPRTLLLMFYRPDALAALHAAGRTATPDPPDDWDELIQLLQAHGAHVASGSGGSTLGSTGAPFPTYGLCVTADPDCGRAGDLLAAVAASVVQTGGTSQGYLYDVSAAPPSAVPLVNNSGWEHAAGLLRSMLAHNAPALNGTTTSTSTEGSGRECTEVSAHFMAGDCMVTFEWDVVWSRLAESAPLAVPGALAMAPLPGSRHVLDRRAGSATAGAVVPCTWELCADSANHDLLYLGRGINESASGSDAPTTAEVLAVAQALSPLAKEETILVSGKVPSRCDERSVAAVEAEGAAEVLSRLGVASGRLDASPPNRAPYSTVLKGYLTYNVDSLSAEKAAILSNVSAFINARADTAYALWLAATTPLRLAAGFPVHPSNGSSTPNATGSHYLRTRWWTPLATPFDTRYYTAQALDANTTESLLRALWHGAHAPNAVPDASSPVQANFVKWALGYVARRLGGSAPLPAANATATLAEELAMVNDAFTADAVRMTYNAAIGAKWMKEDKAVPAGADSGQQLAEVLAAALVSVLGGLSLAACCAACLLWRRRGRHRDLLGRVRVPRVGPDTTLMVSDIQNSTRLWEELSTGTMDAALRLHHAAMRRALVDHDGYESATEGDSFICAFCTPASGLAFAAAVQLALLRCDWPKELLSHPDACELAVDPRVGALQAAGGPGGGAARGPRPAWRPFCAVPLLWQRIRNRGSAGKGEAGGGGGGYNGHGASGGDGQGAGRGLQLRTSGRSDWGSGALMLHESTDEMSRSSAVALELGSSRATPYTLLGSGMRPSGTSAGSLGSLGGVLDSPTYGQPSNPDDGSVKGGLAGGQQAGGGGGWSVGPSSTWGGVLAAAFPVAEQAAAGGPPLPRSCKAAFGFQTHGDRVLCFRGLRVRMGLHTGLDDPEHLVFNKVGSSFKYYGPFAETAKLVSDSAPGGLIVLSSCAFARLRNTKGRAPALSSPSAHGVVVVYAGLHVLQEEGGKATGLPSPCCALAAAAEPRDLQQQRAGQYTLGGAMPLFSAVPAPLVCRLVHCPPLRSLRQVAAGTLAAPTGSVVIAFMKVVGAGTLLADLPGPAARALESLQRLASGLLGRCGGYLLEGGDGLLLAAFGSPLAGVEWALRCGEGLRELDWEEDLLAHELCEEVVTLGSTLADPRAHGPSSRPPSIDYASAFASGLPPSHLSPLAEAGLSGSSYTAESCALRTPLADGEAGAERPHAHAQAQQGLAQQAAPHHVRIHGGSKAHGDPLLGACLGSSPGGAAVATVALHGRGSGAGLPGLAAHRPGPGPSLQTVSPNRRLVERGLRVKVGLDVGPVTYSLVEASGRLAYRGRVMNRAARIAGTAAAGQVLVSGAVWAACEATMADHAALVADLGGAGGQGRGLAGCRLGRLALKGIAQPVEVVLCRRAERG